MIEVVWLDSGMWIEHGWGDLAAYQREATLDSMRVTSVGLFMFEDDDVVALALSHDQQDRWYGVQVIAKQNVISRRVLA